MEGRSRGEEDPVDRIFREGREAADRRAAREESGLSRVSVRAVQPTPGMWKWELSIGGEVRLVSDKAYSSADEAVRDALDIVRECGEEDCGEKADALEREGRRRAREMAWIGRMEESDPLPDKPSELLRIARECVEQAARDPKVVFDDNDFLHETASTGQLLIGCAGALLRHALHMPDDMVAASWGDLPERIRGKVLAVDRFSKGRVGEGLAAMGLEVDGGLMEWTADALERIGM